MRPNELFRAFQSGFSARKFSAGLLVAFIDFYKRLEVPMLGARSLQDVLVRYPQQASTAAGKRANTLIVALPGGGTISLRPFYNQAERYFRAEHKRFDYPSCAPHATQAWKDYTDWLDALATYSDKELEALRSRVAEFVLATLPSQAFDPSSVKTEPALFQLVVDGFDVSAQKGEPTGAPFQGIIFGFLRADNPHLQIEIDKVRTGSKRLQRVADIDGWEGSRLAISAEVKQSQLRPEDVPDLEAFANDTGRRGALGIVAALGFQAGVRELLEGMGLRALDSEDLLRIVELWDPLKQRTAVASLMYYVTHVEKNAALTKRLTAFLETASRSN